MKSMTGAFIAMGMLMAIAHAGPVALKRDADFRQNGFLAGLWDKVKGAASAAGKAALASLGEEEKAMLLKEFQAAEKNFRLNDDTMSRQNGFLAGLWDKVKGAASAAGKAALASLGEEEKAMLLKELQAKERNAADVDGDGVDDDDNDAMRSSDFRQNGFISGLWDKVKGAAAAAGKAALASIGRELKMEMLLKEHQAAKKRNADDADDDGDDEDEDAMRSSDFRQNGFISGLWDKVKGAASAAGKAALASLGEEEQEMLLKELQAKNRNAVDVDGDGVDDDDDSAMRSSDFRQNGFISGLWDKVKGAAAAAGKAALASIGRELEMEMLLKERQAAQE